MLPGKLADAAARRRLPLRQCAARREPRRARVPARPLSVFALSRVAAGAQPSLVAPSGVDGARLERIAEAVAFGRDLVNTPANDLGPDALEAEALRLAERFGARAEVIRGDDLLARNFPLIHAVGRAAAQAPRLVDFVWGRADAPKVTLVGKGVTFDTGGLDIKPASGMEMMKKDMGGAAAALALAHMIMEAGLDVRLRVLMPIVENSISADAFRPGDVLHEPQGPDRRDRQHRRRGAADPRRCAEPRR